MEKWEVWFVDSIEKFYYDNAEAAFRGCYTYLQDLNTMPDFIKDCIEELAENFNMNEDSFGCAEICWATKIQ